MIRKFRVRIDGQEYEVEVEEVGAAVPAVPAPGAVAPPSPAAAPAPPPPAGKAAAAAAPPPAGGGSVAAPLPGIILEVHVSIGQTVAEGDVLCVLEAMKMENEITAPRAGTVQAVNVTKGSAVNMGDVLVVIG